jgi:hypothetical protein
MAEQYGINKILADIEKASRDAVFGGMGFAQGVGQSVDNFGRFWRSEKEVTPNFSPFNPATGTNRNPAPRARPLGMTADAAARRAGEVMPGPVAPGGLGGLGGGAPRENPIDALFAPMFESLDQRERLANQRYEANREQVTNIYGQITGARTADIATTGEAYKNLTDAASARSTAVNTSIDESEAARLRNNQAALESMGLGGLSTSQGDLASQGAAMAKGTNVLNAENWQGLLTAMGATSQDLARSDVTGFNYRMGEDLGQLRGARENFQENIGQERTGLLGQRAQASFDYQRAQQAAAASAAAAAQRALADAGDSFAKQQADALKGSGPVTQVIANRFSLNLLSAAEAANATNAINEWFANVPPPAGAGKWNSSSAKSSILGLGKGSLNKNEQDAIVAVFDAMTW